MTGNTSTSSATQLTVVKFEGELETVANEKTALGNQLVTVNTLRQQLEIGVQTSQTTIYLNSLIALITKLELRRKAMQKIEQ